MDTTPDHSDTMSESESDADDSEYFCGVCDELMNENTESIACTKCRQWVHLSKCAGLKRKDTSRKRAKFECSRCKEKKRQEKQKQKENKKRNRLCAGFLKSFEDKGCNSKSDQASNADDGQNDENVDETQPGIASLIG